MLLFHLLCMMFCPKNLKLTYKGALTILDSFFWLKILRCLNLLSTLWIFCNFQSAKDVSCEIKLMNVSVNIKFQILGILLSLTHNTLSWYFGHKSSSQSYIYFAVKQGL